MKQLRSYLIFNGNCREAMCFYKACFGGELYLQTVGRSPLSSQMPSEMKDVIVHAELRNEDLVLMGSDMCSESGLIKGNSIAMALDCSTEMEARVLYKKLADGGDINQPLQQTYWGALFGSLTDKYGRDWLIHHNRSSISP